MGVSENWLKLLVRAGCLAPSGDNTQPWRFVAAADAVLHITVHVVPERDRSPMNAGQRMARVAVGAALENMSRAAAAWGAQFEAVTISSEFVETCINPSNGRIGELPAVIAARVTNRRFYDGAEMPDSDLATLKRMTLAASEVNVLWLHGRSAIQIAADLIGRADEILFRNGIVRRAFLENIRFDKPPNEGAIEGLSVSSLEASRWECLGLRVACRLPDRIFEWFKLGALFRRRARQLVESASGLCVVVARDWAPRTDFAVGRAMESAWLAMTERGFAAQPMMSLPVLENMEREGVAANCGNRAGRYRERLEELRDRMKALLGLGKDERVAAILRFGRAEPPSGRTGRRPVEEVLEVATGK